MIRWQSHRSLSVSALVVALMTVLLLLLLLLGGCGSGPTALAANPSGPPVASGARRGSPARPRRDCGV